MERGKPSGAKGEMLGGLNMSRFCLGSRLETISSWVIVAAHVCTYCGGGTVDHVRLLWPRMALASNVALL